MRAELLGKIIERRAVVGVIGLGYVGLPLVVEFGRGGFNSVGFDVDATRVEAINSGRSYIPDVPTEMVRTLVERGKLSATTDFSRLADADAVIICVPTPLRKTKEPDISYILAAAEQVRDNLHAPQLVILESTTYPGTTDEVLLPMLQETGCSLDKDFYLAFSPERVDPGNKQFHTNNIPKVVGGVSAMSTEVAAALYQTIVERVHKVSSARVAETAKLLENTFRSVNIALVNEMAQLCYHLGIDSWEVIQAAATKPFGFMPFYPGPGIGGHCLTGSEMIVVRAAGSTGERIEPIAAVFSEQYASLHTRKLIADAADVISQPRLEALSLDIETQQPKWKPVSYLFRRKYEGEIVTIITSDNRRLTVTDRHPMLVSGEDGRLRQVFARDLVAGNRIPIHCTPPPVMGGLSAGVDHLDIDLLPLLPPEIIEKTRVRISDGSWRDYRTVLREKFKAEQLHEFIRQDYLPLSDFLTLESSGELHLSHESLRLYTGRGPGATSFPAVVRVTAGLARLIGYYLAEGCITQENGRLRVRFTFNRGETEFIDDVRSLLASELGVRSSVSHSRIDHATHIRAASPILGWLLDRVFECGRNSREMKVPNILMGASPVHRRELLKGLLRGDGDVYVKVGENHYQKNERRYTHRNASAEVGYFSSSPQLFQQSVYLLQNFGFTPTFNRNKPHLRLKGRNQLLRMHDWLGTKGAHLERYFSESRRAPVSKTFKQSGMLTTVPIKSVEVRRVEKPIDVYSLEVEDTHTFATSYGIYVHNCIPLDPHYLSWKARLHGFEARFISLAEEVNSHMPRHVVQLAQDGLNNHGKPLKGSRILVLGVAYKRDIDDMRESPALGIIDQLLHKGAEVSYHDPYVPQLALDGKGRLESVALTDEALSGCDCALVVTDHSAVDYARVLRLAPLIVDTRNVTRSLGMPEFAEKIIRL
ncbi:MAG TPA: nucleotide sugar dehydrogenase [Blastocatellia bacterium]|nr:nucleotide sugar dehydrogenase [Blastocatellia bacterium]